MKPYSILSFFLCFLLSFNSIEAYNSVHLTLPNSEARCPAPVVTGFSPVSGPENTVITITGSNFTDVAIVQMEGENLSFNIINDNTLAVFAPESLVTSAQISLISSGGCFGISANTFTLIESDCSTGNTEIYMSEIYDSDGGSYGVIELFNPTNAPVVLNGIYELWRYGTIGDATPSTTIPLSGTIDPLDTFIIEMGSTGNTCSGLLPNITLAAGINENDELRLLKNGGVIDVMYTDDEIGYTFIRNEDAIAPSTTFDSNDWMLSETEDCADLRMHSENPDNSPDIIQPMSQSVCENGNTSFTVSVSSGTYTYQWKVLDTSGNWVDLTNNANYSGVTTSTLSVNNIPFGFDGNQYYCEMTTVDCELVSIAVQLLVNNPEVDMLMDQTVCDQYILPTLTSGNYFTASDGNGMPLNAGDVITTDQTLFIYNEAGTAPNICSNESSFTITVASTPAVDNLADQTVCNEYILPVLTNGNYFTASGGNGMQLNAGDVISASQTIFIFNEVGIAPDVCSNESSFTVTVSGLPLVNTINNQSVCNDYTLPTLTNGNYFTASGGNGMPLNAGDVITSDQTIFIYNETGTAPDICSNESSFTITVASTPVVDTLADQTVCDEYILPVLTNGNYFTASGGNGMPLNAGDVISVSQTIFIFNEVGTAPDVCSNESSFTVTVSGLPLVDSINDQSVCNEYTLPTLTNGNYFTASGGNGMPLNAGDVITSDQTIFIYNETGTAPDICSNESSFTITVASTPVVDTLADQTVCDEYILPVLTNGNYFTASGGNGMPLNAGDVISASQTIFIFNEVGTAPDVCSNESSFTVTVSGLPLVDTINNQSVCNEYTLPTLTSGNYFTASGGDGMQLNAGDVITSDQTIFIYNETGTAPDICSNESSFTITVASTPAVDTLTDQIVCDEYILPVLTNGNYFTASGGNGMPLNAGDVISASQTIFIFNEVGTAPDVCSNESSFTVTVSGLPLVDTINDQSVCNEYTLPTLINGNYFTASGGNGMQLNAGDVITTDQTIFIYNETGTAPDICSNESSFTIIVDSSADFSLTQANIDINNGILTVTMNNSVLNFEYAINDLFFQSSNVFSNLTAGSYILYVKEVGGCLIKSLAFNITIDLFIPKYLTPNDDGFKDTWKIIDRNNLIKEVYIFDRYGKLLKHIIGNAVAWDGTYNGQPLETNDYWYIINLRNNKQLKGHFTLKR